MPKIDRSTPPEIIRQFRRRTGLSQRRLGELIGFTDDAIGGFERDGAPEWMRAALFGIAVREVGLRADAAAALVGISPPESLRDHVPSAHGGDRQVTPPRAAPRGRGSGDGRE